MSRTQLLSILRECGGAQSCAEAHNANNVSTLHWKFCSVNEGRVWSSTRHYTL